MKVVVLGGYGVFGARLVRLLVRDGHEVVVAGRTADKAAALAQDLGVTDLVVDRAGDLGPLWAVAPDAVVDAAGPFHAYGADTYALAKACIAQGVHYLDLADDPAFCAGIGVLNQSTKDAGAPFRCPLMARHTSAAAGLRQRGLIWAKALSGRGG